MSFRARFHHLSDLLEGYIALDWEKDWPYLVFLGGITLLTGPLYVFGCWIQEWNDRTTPWDASDHWEGTREFAITFAVFDALLIIALVYFAPQLSAFWSRSLVSWLFYHLAAWYLLWTLLAPAFALLAERIDPRIGKVRRVRLPSEQPPPKPAPVEEPPATQPARSKRGSGNAASSPASKKRNKGRTVPLGTLLLQEREEQERRRTQVTFVQAPLLAEGAQEARLPETPPPAPAPPPKAEKPERRKPEPLDHLF
jgi:pyruvate/2-oxoglutarate dehydrogenase complex dihydrolipoamide acyltransferase (E2) component